MNASVREYRQLGIDSVLGLGAVLLCDLPDRAVWAGIPARALHRTLPHLSISPPIEESS